MEGSGNSTFAKLQPICVKLARTGSVEDINTLLEVVKEIEKESLVVFQGYIVFPLSLILMKNPNEKLMLKAIDLLTYIFDNSETNNSEIFTSIFVQLINLLTNLRDPEKVSDVSEELKYSVCRCLNCLVRSSNDDVLFIMYDQPFRLTLAQAFFVFVQLLKYEKSKSLRQTLLQTIGVFTYNKSYYTCRSTEIEVLASKSLTQLFPGLSSALMNIICGDINQGQTVIRLAVNVFGELIALVISDKCLENCIEANANVSSERKPNTTKLESTVKGDRWFKETSEILKVMITNMKILVLTHSHWKVRLEFLNFIDLILDNCIKSLENCFSVLLPAVYALSVDNNQVIASQSSTIIKDFSEKFQSRHSNSLLSLIEEDIHISSSRLIKCKLSSNDTEKLTILRSIYGYVQIFGKSVDSLLLCTSNLERIFLSFMTILEFDTNAVNLVEDISLPELQDFSSPISDVWPKKKFAYFQNEEIVDTVNKICYHIGQFGNVCLVTDFLFEKLHSSELFELQCIFIISKIFEGIVARQKTEDNIAFVNDTLTELLSSVSANQSCQETSIISEESSSQNNEIYNSNKVYRICLILETIGKGAKVLKIQFKILLMKTLFSVLEQSGSSNSMISMYGMICLYSIACYCNYPSVSLLIQENVDYIMNSITVNFHHFVSRPKMAVALSVVMRKSNAEILPLCKDAIYHLLNLLDCNQDKAYILLKIVATIIQSIKKWHFKPENPKINASAVDCSQDKNLNAAVLTYQASNKVELDDINNDLSDLDIEDPINHDNIMTNSNAEDPNNFQDESTAETDYNKPPPLYVDITADILKRCCHLQSSSDLHIKVLSLEIIETCILILGDFERQLHPVIHELWPRFIWRFNEESIVYLAAFNVLLIMADKCLDFIRTRVLKDVAGKLMNFLKRNSSSSLKCNFRNYQWQNTCKLHLHILTHIGRLFSQIDVDKKDIAQLAEVCLPYLDKSQSRTFQDAAYKTLNSLRTLDPDAMWLYYNILYCEDEFLSPTHKSLQTLHFPNSSSAHTDFKL